MSTRVAVLTSVHSPWDVRIFHRECRALAAAGYEVTVVGPADLPRQEQDGITVLGIPKPRRRWRRPGVWWRLFRQVQRLRPAVVHFHDPELLLLVPLLRLGLGRRVKIVYDAHEYFIDSLRVKYWIPRPLRPAVAFVARWAERLLVRGLDGLVCAVEGQVPLYRYFRGAVAVVRNLPAASLFEGARPHPALDVSGFKLIYVGLILPQRGIDVLLEAIRILHQRGADDIHLFLLGPLTAPGYVRALQSFAQAHRVAGQVHWLGPVPHDQLRHYLANADVGLVPVVITRQYRNPSLSTKLFEYMLSGLPVLAADCPDYRVFVEESSGGLVVPGREAPAYAEAILWLRDHADEARAMGQRGKAMVLDHYTWEKEQERLVSFYGRLLERPRHEV